MVTCNFCLRLLEEGKVAIAAPRQDVHICEDCVELCRLIIEKEKQCPTG